MSDIPEVKKENVAAAIFRGCCLNGIEKLHSEKSWKELPIETKSMYFRLADCAILAIGGPLPRQI